MKDITFLRILMMREELSNKELAKKLEVSEANLKEWVNGERNIPFQWFSKFREILRIDNPELLSEKMKLPSLEDMGLIGDATVINVQKVKNNRQVIWQPVGTELRNFYRSVLNEYGDAPIHLEDKNLSELYSHLNTLGIEGVSAWGVKDGKNYMTLNKFQRIENGDIVMFYSSQKFIAYGEVVGKLESEKWSKELWLSEEFKNIYVLQNVRPIDFDFLKFTERVYGKASKSLQSLRILDDEKAERVFDILSF